MYIVNNLLLSVQTKKILNKLSSLQMHIANKKKKKYIRAHAKCLLRDTKKSTKRFGRHSDSL